MKMKEKCGIIIYNPRANITSRTLDIDLDEYHKFWTFLIFQITNFSIFSLKLHFSSSPFSMLLARSTAKRNNSKWIKGGGNKQKKWEKFSCQMLNRKKCLKNTWRILAIIGMLRVNKGAREEKNVKESHFYYVFYEMRVIIDMRKYKYSFRISFLFSLFVLVSFFFRMRHIHHILI